MPGAVVAPSAPSAMDLPVEPQSLKKLSLKSLKRALDLFAPVFGQNPTPDTESKRLRITYKVRRQYGLAANSSGDQGRDRAGNAEAGEQWKGNQAASAPLALPGIQDSRAAQNDVGQTIVPASSMLPRGPEIPIRNAGTVGSVSDRPRSTSALMERIPSRWPRPV